VNTVLFRILDEGSCFVDESYTGLKRQLLSPGSAKLL